MGERGPSPNGQVPDGPLDPTDAPRRRKRHLSPLPAEGDEAHKIAPLVGVVQEAHQHSLGQLHAAVGPHGSAGVQDHQEQVPVRGPAHFLPEILHVDQEGTGGVSGRPAGRCGPQGGIHGHVHGPAPRPLRPHVRAERDSGMGPSDPRSCAIRLPQPGGPNHG